MPIFVGGSDIKDIKIGTTTINSVWVGATKVWQRGLLLINLTNGLKSEDDYDDDGYEITERWRGYNENDFGSVSTNNANPICSSNFDCTIQGLYFYYLNSEDTSENTLYLIVKGSTTVPTPLWLSMDIDDAQFLRANASTWMQFNNKRRLYRWYTSSNPNAYNYYPNPFPNTSGTSVQVVFN